MAADTFLFIFALFDTGALLFLTVYYYTWYDNFIERSTLNYWYNQPTWCWNGVITLSDLECDYLNAQQCCSKLNAWVIPEIIGHGLVTLLLLLTSHWVLFLVNVPMIGWQIYKCWSVPSGNFGVYDPTEIHNRGMLKSHMKETMVKLGYYLIFFFIYLYCMIVSMLISNPSPRLEDNIEF